MNTRIMAITLASATMLTGLSACETVAEEVTEAIGFEYVAMLAPTSGGTGSGKAEVSINDATNMICVGLDLSNGVQMTDGHLMGPGGSMIMDIDTPDGNAYDGDNDSNDCETTTDAVVDAIRANPSAYSVHIMATTGELRGTLMKES